ncbi:ABC1 protein [Trypanosoma rangeli SC58]|uniref:ABC1 protein n=1 Tax=Trypanosoma rangeli SC58 TaxID=429131 RepID=A0A061J229_TRYRA|nr:ABC1 protein [Trypanosoma rangeli SC58]
MLSRSGAIRSWCTVSRGLVKIVAAMAGATEGNTTTPASDGSNGGSRTPTRVTRREPSLSPLKTLSKDVVAHLRDGKDTLNQKQNVVYRAVPSTRAGRAAGFASLFVQLGWDHIVGFNDGGMLARHSHQRIVETLCRMRGAVLKLGQMLSIQDAATVSPHVVQIFEKVRDSAYAMPQAQLNRTLTKEYGNANWRKDCFVEFDDDPIAAASIGQVHRATVKGDGDVTTEPVAVKVQYPGVAASIDSDIANLKTLIALKLLPPGMFVDNILQELRQELALECRYTIEASKQTRYAVLIQQVPELREVFVVPKVYESLSTDKVLVSQLVSGVPIDRLATITGNQDLKNYVAQRIFFLTLSELFCWRFMQTDPNYSNFLFDAETNRINLLDFGAAREYSAEFVRDYLDVVAAAAQQDRDTIIAKSIKLGFLTGNEMKLMLDAHVSSVMLLGKPFRHRDRPFDFAAENLPSLIQEHVPTMIKLRLRPPPTPVYSLHRRLSGTILLATKLKATVNTGELFWNICDSYRT